MIAFYYFLVLVIMMAVDTARHNINKGSIVANIAWPFIAPMKMISIKLMNKEEQRRYAQTIDKIIDKWEQE